jgi:SsrA-binding protein
MPARSTGTGDTMGIKIVTENRRARHDYHTLERHEAGIVLQGTEVKALRAGHITLKDSFADDRRGELFLVGAHIEPYEKGNINNHDPERPRKLLLHKQEILKLGRQVAEKGLTLIPLKVYFSDGRAKVEIGLCRGKNTIDKRHTLRDREMKREVDRDMKDVRKG